MKLFCVFWNFFVREDLPRRLVGLIRKGFQGKLAAVHITTERNERKQKFISRVQCWWGEAFECLMSWKFAGNQVTTAWKSFCKAIVGLQVGSFSEYLRQNEVRKALESLTRKKSLKLQCWEFFETLKLRAFQSSEVFKVFKASKLRSLRNFKAKNSSKFSKLQS